MKTFLLAAALATTQPAPSDAMDFASFTCREYLPRVLQTPPESPSAQSVHLIHFWLHGYVSGKAAKPALSQAEARDFVAQLIRECGADRGKSVLQAAEAAYRATSGS